MIHLTNELLASKNHKENNHIKQEEITMATGGFKAFEHVFTGTSYTSYSAYSTAETAVKALLKALTQKIIATEPHWTYDSNFTATADDFVKIGTSSSEWYHANFAQFLINTVTGSKLLIYYNLGSNYQLQSINMIMSYSGNSSYAVWGYGLCMSMIPGGSNQTWDITDNCTTANFIPYEATPVIGTGSYPAGTSSSATNATFLAQGGYTHRYVFLVKEDVIMLFWQQLNSGELCGCNAIGKLYGTLCNASDTGACSKYGCIIFKSDSSDKFPEASVITSFINNRTAPFIKREAAESDSYSISEFAFASYFAASTAERPFSTSSASISASNQRVFNGNLTSSSTSNKTAFTPFLMGGIDVTADSKFKGYLDTDIFRGVYFGFPYNTLFDDGKFIYVGSGLAVGWDASNDVILRT